MADEQVQTEEQKLQEDLAGYPSKEALVQGYRASGEEARKWRAKAEVAEAKLQGYQAGLEANPRQPVRDRSNPRDRLTEFGVPVDAIEELLDSKMSQAFQPIMQGINARQTVMARYPDYNKFESDVNQFIQSDPELNQTYQRMFSADPVGAFEYAFLKFGDSRKRGSQQRDEAAQQDMSHAALPSMRNGDSRRQPEAQTAGVQKAWEEWQRTGSTQAARNYAKARLRTVISDEFLNA